MIKQVLTAIGMFISTVSFSEGSTSLGYSTQDPTLKDLLEAEIQESCGHLLADPDEFKQCVEIVTIEFTVLPHNTSGGGVCPGPCDAK